MHRRNTITTKDGTPPGSHADELSVEPSGTWIACSGDDREMIAARRA